MSIKTIHILILNYKGLKQNKIEYALIDSLILYSMVEAYKIFQPLIIMSNDKKIHNYLKVWSDLVDRAKVYPLMDKPVIDFISDYSVDTEEIYKIVVGLIHHGLKLAREDSPILHQKYKGVK